MAGLVRAGQATGVLVDGWARQSRPGDQASALFHSFTFANAQGTDLRTGTVAILCLTPTHSGVAQVIELQSYIAPAASAICLWDRLRPPLPYTGKFEKKQPIKCHDAGYCQLGS